ncbi:T9SS type A sorting domain-containing protein [Desulfosarcina sp.]|nr:T9SS type A sorting domain-containing protein [Desulfosarcina sp.]
MKTKTLFYLFATGLILFVFMSTNSFSQLWFEEWERHPQNPIMDGPVDWTNDFNWPKIIHEDDTYKMWFTSQEDAWEIGYAWSLDGYSWEIHQAPVISSGTANDWDYRKAAGAVLRIDDTLRMWYSGLESDWDPYRIGYAWSLDGISWQLNEEPVLVGGAFPAIHYDGTIFHMYYNDWLEPIYYATSEDGITWTKANGNNPVIEMGAPGTWNDAWIFPNGLIMHNDTLHMFFAGWDDIDNYITRTGYAWSVDFINWTVNDDYVFDVVAGGWESQGNNAGTILFEDDKYRMWYAGGGNNTESAIGYAEILISSIYESNIVKEVSTNPNPFQTSTTIEYELSSPENISMTIYNHLGVQIEAIEKKQSQGKQQVVWNAEGLPAGVYFCVLKTNKRMQTQKIIKL